MYAQWKVCVCVYVSYSIIILVHITIAKFSSVQSVSIIWGGGWHRPSGCSPCLNGCSPGVDPSKVFPAQHCW